METIDLKTDRILITGANGFLGKHVAHKLRERGAANNLILPPRSYDLVDMGDVWEMFDTHRPTAVIHLAATVGGIGANQARPGTFFFENMQMGMNIIDACRIFAVGKLLNVGTICSYPKFSPVPFQEENLWHGYPEETNAPYGIAKRALIVMAEAYRQQYGLNTITVLPTNLYGPGDHFHPDTSHVIPALIRKFAEATGGVVEIWGDGLATRDFLYVEDAAEGLVLALEKYNSPGPINLGTQLQTRISDLAYFIQRAMFDGREPFRVTHNTSKPNGQPKRCVSFWKAQREIGWSPKTTLMEGLKKTVEWYLNERIRGE